MLIISYSRHQDVNKNPAKAGLKGCGKTPPPAGDELSPPPYPRPEPGVEPMGLGLATR